MYVFTVLIYFILQETAEKNAPIKYHNYLHLTAMETESQRDLGYKVLNTGVGMQT